MVIWKGQLRSRSRKGTPGRRRARLLVVAASVLAANLVTIKMNLSQ